jgi:hypothetical protein
MSRYRFFFLAIGLSTASAFAAEADKACPPEVAAIAAGADDSGARILNSIPKEAVVKTLMGEAKELSDSNKRKTELGEAMKDYIASQYSQQIEPARKWVNEFFTADLMDKVAIDNPEARLRFQEKMTVLAKNALANLPQFQSSVLDGVKNSEVVEQGKKVRKAKKWWDSRGTGQENRNIGVVEGTLELTEYVDQMREIARRMAPPEDGKFQKDGKSRALAHKVLPFWVRPTKSQFLTNSNNQAVELTNLSTAIQARYDLNERIRTFLINDAKKLMLNSGTVTTRLASVQALIDATNELLSKLPEGDKRREFIQNEFIFNMIAMRSAMAKIIVQYLVAAQKHGILIGQFNHVQVVGRAAAHAAATGIMAEAGVAYSAGELDGTMQGTMELEELNQSIANSTVTHLQYMQANMAKFDEAVSVRVESVRSQLAAISELRTDDLLRRQQFIEEAEKSFPEVVRLIGDANKQADQILLQIGASAKVSQFIEGASPKSLSQGN